ncbi:hypothetical protein [Chroococcidiopsis sp.]|uniref:hypothetical protein n=1 Tax=Chroococcidiopsis sp. TaxID=3088168 RepID=UPI003F40E7E0
MSNYTKPELRAKLLKKIKASSKGGKAGQWTATKAQMLAKAYKAKGGSYKSSPTKKQRSLKKWAKSTTAKKRPSKSARKKS